MFIQKMPGFGGKRSATFADMSEEDLTLAVEHAFGSAPSYGQWFEEKGNREDIIYGLFRNFNPSTVLERDITFSCPCSQERYTQAIKNLGKEELDDIKAKDPDPLEVVCHNCGSVYYIPKASL